MNRGILMDLVFIGLIAPILIYIGIQRASSPEFLYQSLVVISMVLMIYHLYFAYTNWQKGSSSLWVNLFICIVVAPVLAWIGYHGKNTTRHAFELVLLLGFGTLGYHIYTLFLKLSTVSGGITDY
jgi:hypothetical protein